MADTKDFLAGVTLTDAAAAKAKALIDAEGRDDLVLRLALSLIHI